eukprot:PhM_4_TR485/c0_g1_i1/m.61081
MSAASEELRTQSGLSSSGGGKGEVVVGDEREEENGVGRRRTTTTTTVPFAVHARRLSLRVQSSITPIATTPTAAAAAHLLLSPNNYNVNSSSPPPPLPSPKVVVEPSSSSSSSSQSNQQQPQFLHRVPVPNELKYTLDPFSKFRRFGKFPFKFAISVCVLIILLVQLFVVQMERSHFENFGRQTFWEVFYPKYQKTHSSQTLTSLATHQFVFVDASDFTHHMHHTARRYYDFVSTSPGIFLYKADSTRAAVAPPKMFVEYFDVSARNGAVLYSNVSLLSPPIRRHELYNLTLDSPAGPFEACFKKFKQFDTMTPAEVEAQVFLSSNNKTEFTTFPCEERELKNTGADEDSLLYYETCRIPDVERACDILDYTRRVEISFEFNSFRHSPRYYDRPGSLGVLKHVLWHIKETYQISGHNGVVDYWLSVHSTAADTRYISETEREKEGADGRTSFSTAFLSFTCMDICFLLLFITWDIILRLRSLRNYFIFQVRARREGVTEAKTTKPSTKHYKNLLNFYWVVWFFATDGMTLLYAMLEISVRIEARDDPTRQTIRHISFGLSILMTSLGMLSYLFHFSHIYVVVHTLTHAVPRLLSFGLPVFILFMCYAIFGVVMFGSYSPYFSTIDHSAMTLFCSMQGDSLQMHTFNSLAETDNKWVRGVSRCFMYSFIMCFLYLVHHVSLNIVQDSFYFLKKRLRVYRQKREDFENEETSSSSSSEADSEDGQHEQLFGDNDDDDDDYTIVLSRSEDAILKRVRELVAERNHLDLRDVSHILATLEIERIEEEKEKEEEEIEAEENEKKIIQKRRSSSSLSIIENNEHDSRMRRRRQ